MCIMRIDKSTTTINNYYNTDPRIEEKLDLIIQQNKKIMSDLSLHQAALGRIEVATTKVATGLSAVATRITALEDRVKTLGLTKDQEDQILAHTEGLAGNLEVQADALTQMGKTPENPVPVEPIEPPAEPIV